MKTTFVLASLGAAMMLAGCGDTDFSNQPDIGVRSPNQDALFELSPLNRDITMRRALTQRGYTCDRVERSGFVTEYENVSMWTATCDDGREWALFIGADDSVQIRTCEAVLDAGLPACEITRADTAGAGPPELAPVEPGSNEPYPEAEGNSDSSTN